MRFRKTEIPDVWIIEPELHRDERGGFARTWCRQEFAARGLNCHLEQCGTSFNARRGTLRGLHYQDVPHAEDKLVRCASGAIFDVVVDLRPGSPSRYQWLGIELSAENRAMAYVPAGCAHGFLTLVDGAEVFYQISAAYRPASARGVRWNDPLLSIRWPDVGPLVISARDRELPLLSTSETPDYSTLPTLGAHA